MMVSVSQAVFMILLSGAITFALRALPFVIFGGRKELPPLLGQLAKFLPPAIMAVLVIYCFKTLPLLPPLQWLPSLLATLATVGLHLWKKHTILSVFVGTACYMVLLQVVY